MQLTPRLRATLGYLALAFVAYVPVLRSDPGNVAADTKTYLYLDPGRLLARALTMWDPNVAMGTVTHQTIGYLYPMGPYYWCCEVLGLPDWVAQRLWLGTILFMAGCGVLYLLRTFALRGPGVVVAALAYMLSPYSLDYAARISVLLLPWAALPWMIGLMRKALRDGGWRYPALFAIVVQTVGGVNATALLFAGLGPALWVLYSWLVAREVQWRRALGVAARTGALTLLTSLWWIAGLSIQGGYGLNVLRYSETVEAVARTSTPNEILRGLGYWFFYGQDRLGPWIEAAENYTQNEVVILAGYALVALALLAAGFVRWKHRVFFVGLLLVGVVVAVGAHPYESPTPLGSVFKAFATSSTVGLALRSTARAVPLVALSLAVLLGVGLDTVHRALRANARPVLAFGSVVAVVALIVVNFPALFDGTYYGQNLQRPEEVPQYWKDAAAALDARDHDTRVLELPGSDFASYRWGNTVDPITPGLMDRPYVARELIPFGGPGTADLLNAIDHRIQDGLFEPEGFAALLRRMGVGDVVLRNDLQYERYDLVSPRELARDFAAVPGLGSPTAYGDPTASVPVRPSENATSLAAPPGEAPPAPVVVYPVEDPVPIVRAESAQQALMVSGDGEGLVDVAAIGLLDGAGVVQYSASFTDPDALRAAIAPDTTLVVTDSNRRRARRWTSVRDTTGVTEQPGEKALKEDLGDARLDVFPTDDPATQATMDQQGVAWVTATHYGNTITYRPEDAAARAFDGDLRTAWRASAYGPGIGERLHLVLDEPITTDRINVVQPLLDARDRYITEVTLRFDGGDEVRAALDGSSRTPAGQTIVFEPREFRTLDIEITDLNVGKHRLNGVANGVGFAEIRVRDDGADHDVRVSEVVRMPSDLLRAVGSDDRAYPLVLVMVRDRVEPVPPRRDPERAIARSFTLPSDRTFALTGTARLTSDATPAALAAVFGVDGIRTDASATLPNCVACGPDAAIDGDVATAWQTPFTDVRGQWAAYELDDPVTFDHMDLTVFADGRHSVPRRLRLEVDGDVRVVTVPEIADQPAENATATVQLAFAPVTGSRIRVVVEDVRDVSTFNYYANATTVLPVAIAEWGIPGVAQPTARGALPAACRTDLLTIDGRPVPVRVRGTIEDARAGAALEVAACDSTVELPAGTHELRTAPGVDTGIHLDRLVLASDAGGGPLAVAGGRVTGLPDTPPSVPDVTVVDEGRTRMRVRVDNATEPFWLVLGQSHSAGWHASSDGAQLGERRLVDGYANGWLVDPDQASFDVVLDWTPQRRVWLALGLSALGMLLCVAVVVYTSVRRRGALAALTAADPSDAETALVWPLAEPVPRWSPRARVLVPLGMGVLGAITVAWWVGLVVAALVFVGQRSRIGRLVLLAAPAALVAVVGVYMAWSQTRYDIPPVFEWPTLFPRARTLAWCAVLLAVGAAVLDLLRARPRRSE